MQRAIDIGPMLLPWHSSPVEAYYGKTRELIEQALADLSHGFWQAVGVAVPQPSAFGRGLLRLGRVMQIVGCLCVLCVLPFAIVLFVLAAMERPEDAIVALIGTGVAALGSLLVPAAMAIIHRGKRLLLRLPLDLAPRAAAGRNPRAGRLMQRYALALDVGFVLVVAIVGGMLALGDPAAPVDLPLLLPLLPSLPALLVFAAATLVVGTLLLAGSIALFRRGLATLQPTAHELLATDGRKPVLLLRSFGDDKMSMVQAPTLGQIKALARMEESIADQFRPFGPLVAIGKPGEKLPELGASRTYYSDSEWRAAALDLMQQALVIVVIAGVSPGLRWELEAIAHAGHHAKLIVLMPEPHRQRRWDILTEELRNVPGFDGLPREVPRGLLCMHAASGAGCTLLSARQSWKSDYDAAIQFAIYGVLGATSARRNVEPDAAGDIAERAAEG
jgi:hypothetical protein